MTNKNESRDDCISAIKECIKDDLQKPEIIKKMINDYPGVHRSTFYTYYDVAQDQLTDEDAIYVTDGRVGFGTKEPSEKLTIDGNIKFNGSLNKINVSKFDISNKDLLFSGSADLRNIFDKFKVCSTLHRCKERNEENCRDIEK